MSTPPVAKFAGFASRVPMGHALDLGLIDQSFTIEAWICPDGPLPDTVAIVGNDETVTNRGLHLAIRKGHLYLGFYWNDLEGRRMIECNVWTHVAFVYDRDERQQRLYVNGLLDTAKGNADPFLGGSPVFVGSCFGKLGFQGAIQEVRVWNRALQSDALLARWLSACTGDEPGLRAVFPLSSGAAANRVPTTRPLALAGAAWRVDADGSPPNLVFGDGATARVGAIGGALLNRDLTLELQVRPTKLGQEPVTLIGKAAGGEGALSLGREGIRFRAGLKPGDYGRVGEDLQELQGPPLPMGSWSKVAVVRSMRPEPTLQLVVNGKEVARAPWAFGNRSAAISPGDWQLGDSRPLGADFALADVRIWETALAPTQLHQPISDERPAALVAAWALHQVADPVEGGGSAIRPAGTSEVSWVDAPYPVLPDALEDTGAAAVFEGDGHVNLLPPGAGPGLEAGLTVSVWAQADLNAGADFLSPLVSRHGPASGWEMRLDGHTATFLFTTGMGVHHTATARVDVPARWLHLVGTYDGGTVRLFVNGELAAETAAPGPPIPFPGPTLLGRNPAWWDRAFRGRIGDVAIWNKALSTAEIQTLIVGPTPTIAGGAFSSFVARADGVEPFGAPGRCDCDGVTFLESAGPRAASFSPKAISARKKTPPPPADPTEQLRQERDDLTASLSEQGKQLAEVSARADELLRQVRQRDEAFEAAEAGREADRQRQLALAPGVVGLDEVIRRAHDDVQRARAALEAAGGSYRLGKVTLDLRMIPGPQGVGLAFPTVDELSRLGTGSVSALSIDLTPRAEVDAPAVTRHPVPDLSGLTELMARRNAALAGFAVEFGSVILPSGAATSGIGRVAQQLPKAGSLVDAGARLSLFLGKVG